VQTEAAAGVHAWGRSGWLSLDTHDNNLGRFLTYVAAAVRTAYPDACEDFQRALQALPLPGVDFLSELLLSELGELPGNLILVLDDYQQIHNLDVQQAVESLILHAPPNLHMVLATRLDPALPLSRLRVQKQITEVRAAELRFTVDEAALFFARALGAPLADDTVRAFDERAEGWVAGLRLAALSLQDGADPSALALAFRGTQHHILDFLLEQVMAQQPRYVTDFLACTAPLEMLCAPLCSEVMETVVIPPENFNQRFVVPGRTPSEPLRIDSRAVLEYLDRAHLFVVPLDGARHWYRYHHLFRDMLVYWLQTRYTVEEIAAINRRAANWYSRNGHIDAAVRQLLAACAVDEAADLIETNIPAALGRSPWPVVQQLLTSLPDATVARRPVLLLARAWVMWTLQRYDLLPNLLHQAETLLNQAELDFGEPRPPWLQGWIDALWAIVHTLRWDFDAALDRSESALANISAAHGYVRGVATIFYVEILQMLGRPAEAMAYCTHALANEQEESVLRIVTAPGVLAVYRGDLAGVIAAGEHCLRYGPPVSVSKHRGWGHLFLGIAAYEQNNLPAAREHFAAVYDDRFGAATLLVYDALVGLALTHQAMGDMAGANGWAAALLNFATDLQFAYYISAAHWFQCRLGLQRGVIAPPPSGHQWCTGVAPVLHYRWGELPEFTYTRLLVAQASRASLSEAVELLRDLTARCAQFHLPWRQLEAQALLALAYQAQGQEALAHESLLAALRIAAASSSGSQFVRTFVDLGPPMANLLYSLVRKGVAADHIGRLLTAFPLDARNAVALAAAGKQDDEIIEPLSEREVEVLGLLAERLSDKEIAERLRISPLTVRRHSVNLYQKLHVNSRRQAVSRAQALGLLRTPA
jgi:LuxR family maltose regulon positive regulatory protein